MGAEITKKVTDLLIANGFTSDQIHLNLVKESQKLAGFIVSDKFDGMSPGSRQDFLWDLFDKQLESKDRARITAIMTMTPEEEQDYAVGE